MKPFFSVVIPTLNEEQFLPVLLTSLVKQKDKDFEIVVIDGKSDDKTKKVVLSFSGRLLIKFFISQRRQVAFQRNIGAKKSSGKYLIFLDADSGVHPTFIKRLKATIFKRKGLVFIPYIQPDTHNSQVKISFILVNFLIEFSQNITKPFSGGGAIIFEKHFFHQVGGFNERLFIDEDHNLIQRASSWGGKAKFLRNVKVKYSLRRWRRDGQIAVFYKFLIATAHLLFRGDIKKEIFDYKMGGGDYRKIKKNHLINELNDRLKQIKSYFTP